MTKHKKSLEWLMSLTPEQAWDFFDYVLNHKPTDDERYRQWKFLFKATILKILNSSI